MGLTQEQIEERAKEAAAKAEQQVDEAEATDADEAQDAE